MTARSLRFLLVLLVAPLLLQACAVREGLAGKDAIWIATPDALVTRMLEMAQVTPEDRVVDLGSGDGKIIIAAARDFGARGLGIEYDARLVELSRRKAEEAGVAHLARFVQGDIFESDYSNATVVTMYLLPNLTLRLRHTLMAMPPGTRVTAHQYGLGDWPADRTEEVEGRSGHLWIVPANAGGQWRLQHAAGGGAVAMDLSLRQRFQRLQGSIAWEGGQAPVRDARMDGARVSFAYTDAGGVEHRYEGTVDGARMHGTVSNPTATTAWHAERQGAAPRIQGSEPVGMSEQDKARIDSY